MPSALSESSNPSIKNANPSFSYPIDIVGADYISFAPTFFIGQSSLTPSLLLPKPAPLRWAPVLISLEGEQEFKSMAPENAIILTENCRSFPFVVLSEQMDEAVVLRPRCRMNGRHTYYSGSERRSI